MLAQAVDFLAEADELQTLHDGDLMAAASVVGPESFARRRAEILSLRDGGMSRLQETRHRLGHLIGKHLLASWYAQVTDLCDELSALPPSARLTWYGPDMGVRMFATARQMETWAHGQAIYDLIGVIRQASDRLRNIAEIGVRTCGWTFANRGIPIPGPVPYVRLRGPSGAIWEWNDPSPDSSVVGSALDFCQVVTQVRNVADTALQATGEAARMWMRLAQCFAGPPEDPAARRDPFHGQAEPVGDAIEHGP